MMYQEKMAFAIKVDGKILREFGETVYVPFGSEYSILVKNLNAVRALVTIEIDGSSITDGVRLVVGPNESIDIERSIKNGNLTAGNKLKFIEKTQEISDFRGDRIDDGLVRITYEFERESPLNSYTPFININNGYTTAINSLTRGFDTTLYGSYTDTLSATNATANTAGITVEGAKSNQRFSTVNSFLTTGVKKTMVIMLKGKVEEQPVEKPISVKMKPICKTCGKKNKSTDKFCSGCGTSLEIV